MDLTTRYMGLTLRNPLIASASPLTQDIDNIRRLDDAGIAAIVLPSIFEERIEAEMHRYETLATGAAESFPEALSYFPKAAMSHSGSQAYLRLIRRASETVSVPIIASLNGVSTEGWTGYAKDIEQAGAKGLELNIYFIPTDLSQSGEDVERRYLEVVQAVRAEIAIPIAVKLNPYFSAMGAMAKRLDAAGVDALVMFNRLYQADIDLATMRYRKDLQLSTDYEMRLPLLWIAVLAGQLRASLAASTGVDQADQVVKYLLAGADTVMTSSALLRHGIGHATKILAELSDWLQRREIASLSEIRGRMSRQHHPDRDSLSRALYIEILESYGSHDALS